MRKITRDAANALKAGKKFRRGNTEVVDHSLYGPYRAMYLHGNQIAVRDGHVLRLKMAGWGSVTTRERLNGILEVFGVDARFYQEKYEQFLAWHSSAVLGPKKGTDSEKLIEVFGYRGAGHYPLDTRKWMNFTVIDPARTDAPQEWNPPRYWGQMEEQPEAMREYVATYLKDRDLEKA